MTPFGRRPALLVNDFYLDHHGYPKLYLTEKGVLEILPVALLGYNKGRINILNGPGHYSIG